jgi:hypothetical protein
MRLQESFEEQPVLRQENEARQNGVPPGRAGYLPKGVLKLNRGCQRPEPAERIPREQDRVPRWTEHQTTWILVHLPAARSRRERDLGQLLEQSPRSSPVESRQVQMWERVRQLPVPILQLELGQVPQQPRQSASRWFVQER